MGLGAGARVPGGNEAPHHGLEHGGASVLGPVENWGVDCGGNVG